MDFRELLLFLTFLSLSNSIKREIKIDCVHEDENYWKLQVTGNVINISQINISNIECIKNTKLLEIFAVKKVIIDKDLNLFGREMQVVIIAPIWYINETGAVINVSGANAKDLNNPAMSGTKTGYKHGADGRAGLPGGSAGNIYGIANKIINQNKLIVNARGGEGGKGQNGGDGAKGRDGGHLQDENEFDCDKGQATGYKLLNKTKYLYTNFRSVVYYLYGEEGACGGRGGNGGAAGSGGYGGTVVIFNLSERNAQSFVIINNKNESTGRSGTEGIGGLGGLNGNIVKIECNSIMTGPDKQIAIFKPDGGKGRVGERGINGKSLKMRKMPTRVPIFQTLSQTINKYKLYVRPKLAKIHNKNSKLYSFYNSLNRRKKILNLYDIMSLVQEFKDLESQYFISEDRDYLTSSYINLANHIQAYLKKAEYKEGKDEIYKIVMDNLSSLINKRTDIINEPKGYFVMTNIVKGLNSNGIVPKEKLIAKENIYNQLDTLKNRINKLDTFIKKAQDLINNDLQNAMQDLQNTLDIKIDTLLEEISKLINSSIEKEGELVEKRKELQNIMLLKGIFGILKIGCGVAAVLNPGLAVAASLGTSGLSVIESFLTNSDISENVGEISKIGQVLSNATDKFLEPVKESEKEKFFNAHIENMKNKMTEKGKEMVNKMKEKLDNFLKKSGTEPQEISDKSHGFDEQIEIEENDIKKAIEKAKTDGDMIKLKDSEIQLSVFKFIKVTNEIMSTATTTLTNVLKDVKKVDEIDKALKVNKENLQKLYIIEEDIYNQTQPMFRKMFNDINQVGRNMGTMDSSEKLIANWNVQNIIKDVEHKLESTISKFNASEEMNWALEKLTSTFNCMADLYEKIENNDNKKTEAKDTVSLHAPTESKLLTKDHRLASSLAELRKIFYQNQLKDKYTEWIYAFKQFTFPEGGNFLTDYPVSVSNRNEIDYFINKLKRNVENFYNSFITEKKEDQFVKNQIVDNFTGSCGKEKRAFFVWNNESNRESITNILGGKSITLVARGPIKYVESLKFTEVGIVFTSKNSTTQEKLFNVLEYFKVNLTHHGDSAYTFMNKIFVIETNPVSLIFNYPEGKNIIASGPSPMHEKFTKGNYMLSPYATWTVQITPRNGDHGVNFSSLEEFIGKVDLELIGKGQYFAGNKFNEESYKKMIDTYTPK